MGIVDNITGATGKIAAAAVEAVAGVIDTPTKQRARQAKATAQSAQVAALQARETELKAKAAALDAELRSGAVDPAQVEAKGAELAQVLTDLGSMPAQIDHARELLRKAEFESRRLVEQEEIKRLQAEVDELRPQFDERAAVLEDAGLLIVEAQQRLNIVRENAARVRQPLIAAMSDSESELTVRLRRLVELGAADQREVAQVVERARSLRTGGVMYDARDVRERLVLEFWAMVEKRFGVKRPAGR